MSAVAFKLLALGLAATSYALVTPLRRGTVAYTVPAANGGSQLDSSGGLGEPLNVGLSIAIPLNPNPHGTLVLTGDHLRAVIIFHPEHRRH